LESKLSRNRAESPGGREFLMNVVVDEPSVPMTLIQDWMGHSRIE